MNTKTVTWKGIPIEVEYEYEPAQAATFDSPGCDESLHAIEAYTAPGEDMFNSLSERGIAEINALLRETLEGKAQDSKTERALDVVMGRHEWEHFFSHGRRMVG